MIFKDMDLKELFYKKEGAAYSFEKPYKIDIIKIFAKNLDKERLKLKINNEFVDLSSKIEQIENGIALCLYGEFLGEKIEIISDEKFECQFFIRKYHLLIAGRGDAFGSRMSAFVSALYLAKKLDFKFGFVWQKLDKDKGLPPLAGANELFKEEFIKEYDYSKHLPLRGDTNTLCFKSLEEVRQNLPKPWGSWVMNYYILNKNHLSDLNEEEYQSEFAKNFFENLPFKAKYKEQIEKAQKKALELGDFVALHMRAGDAIENAGQRRVLYTPVMLKYCFPVDLFIYTAKHFIYKEKLKVVLFSSDMDTLRKIKEYMQDEIVAGKLLVARDFYENLDNEQEILYESTLISKSKMAVGNHSTFLYFGAFLGKVPFVNFNKLFTQKELLDACLIVRYKDFLNASNVQKTASCIYAYTLAKAIKAPFEKKISLLRMSLEFDSNNSAHRLMMLEEFFNAGQVFRAEKYLEQVINERCEEFLECLLCIWWGVVAYEYTFANYLKNASKKYPYISFVAAQIAFFKKDENKALNFINLALQKEAGNELFINFSKKFANKDISNTNFTAKQEGAVLRVKNHLAYKLGQAMIFNSKSFLGYIRMPYVLSYVIDKHKIEQANFKAQNENLSLEKLENLSDYQEALKIKNYLSYKLGSALIKRYKEASNNVFKFALTGGGLLSFLFLDLASLRKEKRV